MYSGNTLQRSRSRIIVLKAEARSTNGILAEKKGAKTVRLVLTVYIPIGNIGKLGEFGRAGQYKASL